MNEERKNDLYKYYGNVLEGNGMKYCSPHFNYIKYKSSSITEKKGICPPTGLTDVALNNLLKKQLSEYTVKEKEKENKKDFPKRKRKRIDDDLLNFLQK